KLDILRMTGEKLAAAGYLYIGMDHFARPDDELAVAQREGTLYRNFQGYSTHADCDLIGLGITSIGMVGPTYAQNVRTLDEYYARIDAGELAVFRGVVLNPDDEMRRDLITRLICHFALDIPAFEQRWGIDFGQYFAIELERLKGMQGDGLVVVGAESIEVPPAGRLLIRNLCMQFDAYLSHEANAQRFSRVI
ncbi:MAG: coproporphyrinogen III oxidase, partial [Pseudomonadota bacterium]